MGVENIENTLLCELAKSMAPAPLVAVVERVLLTEGKELRARRMRMTLLRVEQQLRKLQKHQIEFSDGLHDLVIQVLGNAAKANSDQKRERLAQTLVRQISDPGPWDDAHTAASLVGALTDLDVEVLECARNAEAGEGVFSGAKLAMLKSSDRNGHAKCVPTVFEAVIPNAKPYLLRESCARLIGHGLLYDDGPGRASTHAMIYFGTTDLYEWLRSWLLSCDSSQSA